MTGGLCTARRIVTGMIILFFGAAASTTCSGGEPDREGRPFIGGVEQPLGCTFPVRPEPAPSSVGWRLSAPSFDTAGRRDLRTRHHLLRMLRGCMRPARSCMLRETAATPGLESGGEPGKPIPRRAASEKWLARDKALHFGLSFALVLGGAAGLQELGMAERDCPTWAGGSVLSLGIFKELAFDRGGRESRASWQDVAADLVGVIAGWYAWDAATKP